MFKTELHLHTPEGSPCSDCPVERIAERYLAAGYQTIVVTDHFTPSLAKREGAWSDTVDRFLSGFRTLKNLLDGSIRVLLGFELRFDGYANDYLVYGLDEAFLRGARDLPFLSRRAGCELIHESGGMIFAAHPFRTNMTVLDPDGLDGIEVFNAHNHHDSRNSLAYAFGRYHNLPGIAGSDFHHEWNFPSAGIMTPDPIESEAELLSILRAGTYRTFGEIVPRG